MKKFELSRKNDKSLHEQIYSHIKSQILNGDIKTGDKLPSYRFMSRKFSINNSTVEKAYNLLETNGYIQKRHGSGCYVLPLDRLSFYSDMIMLESYETGSPAASSVIDFAGTMPALNDQEQMVFKDIVKKITDRHPEILFYRPHTCGIPSLRKTISQKLRDFGMDAAPNSIYIINGCQQGINMIASALSGKNATVIVDEPGYPIAANSFQKAGADIKIVPMQSDGPDIDALKTLLNRKTVDFYYTNPAYQCPTNITFSKEKRLIIAELARQYAFTVIEDDCLSELYFNNKARPTIWNNQSREAVIYMNSFSKKFAPGLRLGYMIVPKRFEKQLALAKFSDDVAAPALLQEALAVFIKRGFYDRHLDTLRNLCIHNSKLMEQAIAKSANLSLPHNRDEGGIFFWVKLPGDIDSVDLWMRLSRKGILTMPGSACGRAKTCSHFLQLNSLGLSDKDIIDGIHQIDTEISIMRES